MKEQSKQKGITLVALVIMIILLLILAGITISALSGENGLITKTKLAKQRYEISEIKEKIEMSIMALRIEEEGKGKSLTKEDLPKINSDEIDVRSIESFPVEVISNGYKFNIDENFKVTYLGETNETVITYTTEPKGYTNKDEIFILLKFSSPIGIKRVEYPQGEDPLIANGKKEFAVDYKVMANGTYTFKVIDNNDNEVTKDVVIDQIDKLEPLDFMPTTEEVKATSLVIRANAQDAETDGMSVKSEIERYEYYVDNTKYEATEDSYKVTKLTPNKTYTFYVKVFDFAGNSKTSTKSEITTLAGSYPVLTSSGFTLDDEEMMASGSIPTVLYDGDFDTCGSVPRSSASPGAYFIVDQSCWNHYLNVSSEYGYYGGHGAIVFWPGEFEGTYISNGWIVKLSGGTIYNKGETRSILIPEGTKSISIGGGGNAASVREVWIGDTDLTGNVYTNENLPSNFVNGLN